MKVTRKRRRSNEPGSLLVSCSTGKRKRKPNSETQQPPSLSDLPLDIVERIIRSLGMKDRIRVRGVCKDWSVLSRNIPSVDKYPWAMRFRWQPSDNGQISGECLLIDPPVQEEHAAEKDVVRGKEFEIFLRATARASSYGWVLFEQLDFGLFLYSPFTREVIKLPSPINYRALTFSLDATCPKCVIFTLTYYFGRNICINICSPGDDSWKTFEFESGFKRSSFAVDAAYANGNFYCVFRGGELGAFNVALEEWSMLTVEALPGFGFTFAKLIVSDGDLQLLCHGDSTQKLKLLKFDFSKKRWVEERNLKNRVLFIGCTSFSCPAIGGTSELANKVFSNKAFTFCSMYPWVTCYGKGTKSKSQQYSNWVQTARDRTSKAWIEVPWSGVWRANDLINAV